MNAKAAELASQITVGMVIRLINNPNAADREISEMTEKSVYFTNGQYTSKRSLHRYEIIRSA